MTVSLVTGGNRGIGLAICKALVERSKDNVVWMGARNPERAAEALATWKSSGVDESARERVHLVQLDVTDQASVDAAAAYFKAHDVTLDVLVNNAGVALDLPWSKHPPTAATCDTTMAVNVRGVQRVFHAMRPLLAKDARVVNVSSGAGPMNMEKTSETRQATLLADDLTEDTLDTLVEEFSAEYKQAVDESAKASTTLPCASPTGWWLQAYGFSKAAVNALTHIWARDNKDLLVTCCTPGLVDTDMVASYTGSSTKKSPEEGAATPVWLATAPRQDIQNGRMYGNDCKLLPWQLHAYSPLTLHTQAGASKANS
ncbi:short-chain dehydrogenase/reductase SDR [Salpingoeca rosetta]|uniref:Short-chain dehydrogenase/reductase SDR n=1 Tax=Salpingoeca rosetta (strain ATCC 50818 / BSB-021) TaxID=946362 RepID=F2TXM8_SALR5|nr:short-chain dehydrogenase/reductase SDR [Salpingoeca rosetta]EGD76137.1 short-chain dehydrogenase/reductase SDR [Salpingoeca rosetta]|eukprot:XP_004998312.1 short-chain dehydrogenase/reductase SDR [Salpingoeca rosetta]